MMKALAGPHTETACPVPLTASRHSFSIVLLWLLEWCHCSVVDVTHSHTHKHTHRASPGPEMAGKPALNGGVSNSRCHHVVYALRQSPGRYASLLLHVCFMDSTSVWGRTQSSVKCSLPWNEFTEFVLCFMCRKWILPVNPFHKLDLVSIFQWTHLSTCSGTFYLIGTSAEAFNFHFCRMSKRMFWK